MSAHPPLPSPVEMAHWLVNRHLRPGDRAIDATAGNGHDTRFLADRVGSTGRVFAFDIQEEALDRTARRVANCPQVRLIHAGHEHLGDHVEGPVTAAMFNLGYLPAGDEALVTRPGTTVAALEQALERLAPRALLTVVLYPGHEGGREECREVEYHLGRLNPAAWSLVRYRPENRRTEPPTLLAVQRRPG